MWEVDDLRFLLAGLGVTFPCFHGFWCRRRVPWLHFWKSSEGCVNLNWGPRQPTGHSPVIGTRVEVAEGYTEGLT